MGFCEKFFNNGTEKLGSHRKKNRHAAYMWPKAAGSEFLLFWISPLLCSQYMKTCEFALFWAQILRAVAATTVGLQACSLYKIRTSGHSPGSDSFQAFVWDFDWKMPRYTKSFFKSQTYLCWAGSVIVKISACSVAKNFSTASWLLRYGH